MMLLAYLFVLTKTAHFLESLVLVVYIVLPRLLMKSALVNASLNECGTVVPVPIIPGAKYQLPR